MIEYSYRALIEPIHPSPNLASIRDEDACQPCPRCRVIVDADRSTAHNGSVSTKYDVIDTFPDFPILKNSAKNGCGLCRFLRKTIRQAWAVRPMDEEGVGTLDEKDGLWDTLFKTAWDRRVRIDNVRYIFEPNVGETSSSSAPTLNTADAELVAACQSRHGGSITMLTLDFGPASTPRPSAPLTDQAATERPAAFGKILQTISFKAFSSIDMLCGNESSRRRLPSKDTLSESNIRIMRSWVDSCKQSHANCKGLNKAWVPTRLLKIEPSALGMPERVRLVETASALSGTSNGEVPVYAALSHMWGVVVPLCTMKANYRGMMASTPTLSLPRNFYEAVIVCSRLGIGYIWIDSLCIVQDDLEDWKREAATMHLVYGNAEVTVVATSATSSRDGFLRRDLQTKSAVKCSLVNTKDPQDYVIFSPCDDIETGLRSGDIEQSLWNTRGWTMQERTLSVRLLHFCKSKVYFECRCGFLSEEGELGSKRYSPFDLWPRASIVGPGDTDGSPHHNGPRRNTAHELPRADLYRNWQNFVCRYSERNLTRSSDKLPAIQSIAAEMSTMVGGEDSYMAFAGMWEQDLSTELLWIISKPTADSRTLFPRERRAPSWSWASLDWRVSFSTGKHVGTVPAVLRDCFHVTRWGPAAVSSPSSSPDGFGFIELRSWACQISQIRYLDDLDYWGYASRANFLYDILTSSSTADGQEEVVFARGNLDSGAKATPLGDTELLYVHISNQQHPSGLLLQRRKQMAVRDQRLAWTRFGVATVYAITGGPLHAPLFQKSKALEDIRIE